jgi:hypothetical protein
MKDEEIVQKLKDIQKEYKAELEDSPEEDRLSFLDRINDLIRSIFNDSSMTVYDVFSKDELEKWKSKRFSRKIKNLFLSNYKNTFYLALLVTITGFLVSEALEFYAANGLVDTKTYIKAILTEVCFIFLSGYRSDNKTQEVAANVLRVGIFCLMIFVITSKTFMDSTKNSSNTNAIQEQIKIIEQQIKEKEKDITYYRDVKQWPNTAKQLIKERDELVKKLIDLKEKQAAGATVEVSDLIRYKAYGNAFFRVLLLFISILITRRLFSF